MLSYENNLQMHFVQIGLEEGERRGKMKAMRDIAFNMSNQGYDVSTIAKCLGISDFNLRYLVNSTDWDICSTTVSECRVNEPVYKV
ncbi:MAG: hypothetical protein HUK23_02560 [Sphaerochaetaceae bacterium]|mgnify:FL=1|nr:hypothetical protein [Sphaerochaetaceae bacterium]